MESYCAASPSIWCWRGPFSRQVGKAHNSHAIRETFIYRSLDEMTLDQPTNAILELGRANHTHLKPEIAQ